MAGGRVLAGDDGRRQAHRPMQEAGWAWRWVGWCGVVLALAALSDYALALYPLGLGRPEWEMATIGSIVQGLPLFSIAMAAVWLSVRGMGRRWLLMVVGVALLIMAVGLFGALLLFVTNVPLGLGATQGVARVGIQKLAVRTVFLGVLFGGSYFLAGVLALRQARRG